MQVLTFKELCERYGMKPFKVRNLVKAGVFKPMNDPTAAGNAQGTKLLFLDEQCDAAVRDLFNY